jgi:CMP-N-acetylneuraminic acid synthetase
MTDSFNSSNIKQRVVALLPMKAHSARVSGKNFREFFGKPLFRWVLDTLLSIEEIDQVVINTDARDILRKNGLVKSDRVLIRDRREEICGDFVSMNAILADDIENVAADTYLMTHTTNPLIKRETILGALRKFAVSRGEGVADSLFTVSKVQTRFYRADATPVNHDPNNLIRTQDLEPWYEENSNLYIFSRDSFLETSARIGKKPTMYETDKLESLDIDTSQDWDLALLAARYFATQTGESSGE